MHPDRTLLGIDAGGTKTVVVFGNENLEILNRTEFRTSLERGFPDFFGRLLDNISKAVFSPSMR